MTRQVEMPIYPLSDFHFRPLYHSHSANALKLSGATCFYLLDAFRSPNEAYRSSSKQINEYKQQKPDNYFLIISRNSGLYWYC